MTAGNLDTVFKLVVGEEGGFVNDPKDRGGATKYGVTQTTLSAWRRRQASVDDVRNLGLDEAKLIFKAQYWNKIQGDRLPPGLDLAVADVAFNSGTGRAVELLQRALGVKVDRVLGEVTLAKTHDAEVDDLINALCDQRLAFLKTTYGWSRFGKGWSNRVARVRSAALDMAEPGQPVGLATLPPMDGTQADHDQAITRTPSGRAKILAGVGAVGTAATDAAAQVQPLMDYLPTLKWLFVALTLVGIGVTFYTQLTTLREEASQ